MEFKQLEVFTAVVDYGSFSEAARHLYLTQPTVSAHIHSLEKELNSRLIIRTTKKMTVTPRGYQLYDYAQRMLSLRNNLIEEFTDAHRKIIDLGASTIPSSYLLPELLCAFGQIEKNTYFHSRQADSTQAIQMVLDGTVDLSLVGKKTEEPSCCFLPFCRDSLVIATPVTDYFLRLKEQSASIYDFLDQPFILREQGSGTKKEMDLFLERHNISPSDLHIIAQMNDLESIKKSIAAGLGISILSARSTQDLEKTKQILLFPVEESAHMRYFYIVYSKNRILKPHVRQFIRFVQNYYHISES